MAEVGNAGETGEGVRIDILRPVGAVEDLRAGIAGDAELGVEIGQGRFDALAHAGDAAIDAAAIDRRLAEQVELS